MGRQRTNLLNQRFGELLVIEEAPDYIQPNGKKITRWLCQCDCGNQTIVRSNNLKGGRTKSCGHQNEKHSHSAAANDGKNTPTYNSWLAMKTRCYNSNAANYHNYGGRGIVVCDRWLNSFNAFLADMGECPEGMSIDRIDNDGNYQPSNCKWSTKREQDNNRRTNRNITLQGRTQTMTQWCRELNLNKDTIKRRLYRGWSEVDALTIPINSQFRPKSV